MTVPAGSPKSRNLTPAQRRALVARRDDWLSKIDPSSLFYPLLDLLPGLYFFAKNRKGEFMLIGTRNLKMHHVADQTELIGLTDFDLHPAPMAKAYLKDDARIYATGEPLLHRVELWFDDMGMPDWVLVYKLPVRARNGEIIGIMGVSQKYEGGAELLAPLGEVAKAVNLIRQRYQDDVSVGELSRQAGISPRQFQRRFKAILGIGPWEFLIKTRVMAACRALETRSDLSLADIALACGFGDQSSFTRHFRVHVGVSPRRFRALRAKGSCRVPHELRREPARPSGSKTS